MNQIDQIKQHFPIAPFVAPHTDGLRRPRQTNWGEFFNGYCPFCQMGKPGMKRYQRRFWVNTASGLCNCLHPSCREVKPMDVINFYARLNNLTNVEAIRQLERQMGK